MPESRIERDEADKVRVEVRGRTRSDLRAKALIAAATFFDVDPEFATLKLSGMHAQPVIVSSDGVVSLYKADITVAYHPLGLDEDGTPITSSLPAASTRPRGPIADEDDDLDEDASSED